MLPEQWITRASLYELLAQSYLYTSEELAEALTSGEYTEALHEILSLNEIPALEEAIEEGLLPYHGRENDEVFHELRREYTRVFIGCKNRLLSLG